MEKRKEPSTPARPAGEPISPGLPAGSDEPARPDQAQPDVTRLDPTRYGDWEKGGRCIDF